MDGDLVDYARQAQVLGYSYVACFAFLLWETCITFSDEVDLLSTRPRLRRTKAAYLLLRYVTLALVLLNLATSNEAMCRAFRLCGPSYCTRWYLISTISPQLITALQQFLMAIRIYALYRRSRRIYNVLFWGFVAEHFTMAFFTILITRDVVKDGLCASDHPSKLTFGVGFPPLLYNVLQLTLTVYECSRGRWRRAVLPTLLLRDGVWAFMLIFAVYTTQGVLQFAVRKPLSSLLWPWGPAASSFAACRLVLRTHQEGAAQRAPVPAESAGFALTTIEPGVISSDDASQW